MLKIRLQRVGRKHEPSFRLVLTDSKNSTKSGRFKEILGSYDPRKTTEKFSVERIKHWLSVGASPTDTVHNLLVSNKIIEGKKKNVLPKKTPPVKEVQPPEEPKAEEAAAEASLVPEEIVESRVEATPEEKPAETPASASDSE